MVGVARDDLVEPIGEALRRLGARRGAVVHGCNGVDEVVGDGPTLIYTFDENGASLERVEPSAFGVTVPLQMPVGGSVEAAHAAFVSVLSGSPGPASDVVALNAAVVLRAVRAETELPAAFERARELLRGGAVWPTFERAKEIALHG